MGELALSIRENYFNLYYKGNSPGKISLFRSGGFKVLINEKFFNGTNADALAPNLFIFLEGVFVFPAYAAEGDGLG